MGAFVKISRGFAVYRRPFAGILANSSKFAHFSRKTLRTAFFGVLLSAASGCAITGVMLRVKCQHQDLQQMECAPWIKLTRDKRG